MKYLRLASAALLSFAFAGAASAATLVMDVGTTFNGTAPPGPGAYARATFTDGTGADSGSVFLTLSMLPGAGSASFIDTWLFNLDPSLDPTKLTFAHQSGAAATVSKGANAYGNNNVSGFGNNSSGLLDIKFAFGTSNGSRLSNETSKAGNYSTSTYKITSTQAISALSFNFLSVAPPTSGPFYYSAAHVKGYDGSKSAGIGAATSTIVPPDVPPAVPEPSSVVLAGVASLAGLAGYVRSRRRLAA